MDATVDRNRPWLSLYGASLPREPEPPRWRNGVELFEDGFARHPDAPSIYYFDTTITHRRHHEEAMAFAVALREELGLQPGDCLALMMQNVPQMVIAIHGAWLAGVTTTALNVMYRSKELAHQLHDSGAKAIVCLESLFEIVSEVAHASGIRLVTASELDYLEEIPARLRSSVRLTCPGATAFSDLLERHRGRAIEPAEPTAADPAALCYTSGTTGPAKGAIITHGNIAHHAEIFARWAGLGEDDVILGMSPMFNVTGLQSQLCMSRVAGGPIICCYRFDAGELLRLIAKWRGSWAVAPITAFIALLEHPDFSTTDLSSLTKIVSGGAPVHPATVKRWEEATGVYIHNVYGLTEATGASHLVPFGADVPRAPVDRECGLAVGIPMTGVDSKVIDIDTGDDLPPGQTGEILIRGPGVTAGYWDNLAESEHVLRDGWLHSGDIGKMDEDGWFYLVDRAKDMIIVSGYKVWPKEVEGALQEHPAVIESCVAGVPDDYSGQLVKAFVTLRRGATVDGAELIAHCRSLLAAYKCPRQIEFVSEIPRTAVGKLMRRALVEGAEARSSLQSNGGESMQSHNQSQSTLAVDEAGGRSL